MGATHDEVLQPHRPGNAKGVDEDGLRGNEGAPLPYDFQFRAAPQDKPERHDCREGLRKARSQCSAGHAHLHQVDKQVVQHHVQGTHRYVQDAGDLHVPASLQHGIGTITDRPDGDESGIDAEIGRCIRIDGFAAAQPGRQERRDGHAHQTEDQRQHKDARKSLTQHPPCPFKVLGAAHVRHLDSKTRGDGHGKAPEDPGTRGYEPDRSGRIGPQMPHHGRVDIQHQHRGELGENGRNSQQHRQFELLAESHLFSIPDQRKQKIFLSTCHTMQR